MTVTIKKGDNGKHVQTIQRQLNRVLATKLVVDGDFGAKTQRAIILFQKSYNLPATGVVNLTTKQTLKRIFDQKKRATKPLIHFDKPRFVVFVDAGHGGISDTGTYVTPGKRAFHKNSNLHYNGHYYEGFENRLIAERFIEACTKNGIMCVRTYHPYKDTRLSERAEIVRSYLRRGYYGYLHSFHSNAISSKNSKKKLKDTRGFMVFSTLENNSSDLIATKHFEAVQWATGGKWIYRQQNRKDGDPDFEANFQILRETDLNEFDYFGAVLEEWGFHSSVEDCEFIVKEENRKSRVLAAFTTAFWVRDYFNAHLNAQ